VGGRQIFTKSAILAMDEGAKLRRALVRACIQRLLTLYVRYLFCKRAFAT